MLRAWDAQMQRWALRSMRQRWGLRPRSVSEALTQKSVLVMFMLISGLELS